MGHPPGRSQMNTCTVGYGVLAYDCLVADDEGGKQDCDVPQPVLVREPYAIAGIAERLGQA